jgi:RNA polymerase sigma-70 factor (ECF subfamily)
MTRTEYGKAYQAGFPLTVKFLTSRGVPRDAAEEAAQSAWTTGWERIDQLRDQRLVRPWVNTIALNLHRRVAVLDSRKRPLVDRAGRTGPDLAAIDLARLLGSCCPSDRALLEHQLHGLTTREIARQVGASEIAVRIRLMRARQSARRAA